MRVPVQTVGVPGCAVAVQVSWCECRVQVSLPPSSRFHPTPLSLSLRSSSPSPRPDPFTSSPPSFPLLGPSPLSPASQQHLPSSIPPRPKAPSTFPLATLVVTTHLKRARASSVHSVLSSGHKLPAALLIASLGRPLVTLPPTTSLVGWTFSQRLSKRRIPERPPPPLPFPRSSCAVDSSGRPPTSAQEFTVTITVP